MVFEEGLSIIVNLDEMIVGLGLYLVVVGVEVEYFGSVVFQPSKDFYCVRHILIA